MHPDESGFRAFTLEHPGLRPMFNVHSASFEPLITRSGIGKMGWKIVIVIEAAIESGCKSIAIENDCTDESGSGIAVRFHHFGQGRHARRERHTKIAHSVPGRDKSGENAGVRGVRDRARRESIGEADAISRQSIESGCMYCLVAVTADVVGPKRVDGDQEDIRGRCNRIPALPWDRADHYTCKAGQQKCRKSSGREPHRREINTLEAAPDRRSTRRSSRNRWPSELLTPQNGDYFPFACCSTCNWLSTEKTFGTPFA
jgi:hypothetical protein